MHFPNNILESIIYFKCPLALWTYIWELYGDCDFHPFPDDPLSDCYVPLHPSENIPYHYVTIMEFSTLKQFETLDKDEVAFEVFDSSSKVVDSLSLETSIIPNQ